MSIGIHELSEAIRAVIRTAYKMAVTEAVNEVLGRNPSVFDGMRKQAEQRKARRRLRRRAKRFPLREPWWEGIE